MRTATRRKAPTTTLNMTPMIDIVFLLITFFMVVSKISLQDQMEIEPPRTETNTELDEPALIITVRHDGACFICGERVDLTRLEHILAVEARLDRSVQVLVRADRRAHYRHIRAILRLCSRRGIGIYRIAFYTQPLEA